MGFIKLQWMLKFISEIINFEKFLKLFGIWQQSLILSNTPPRKRESELIEEKVS